MQVKEKEKDDVLICYITGEINLDNVDELQKVFKKIISAKTRKVLLDFKGLDYIDSAGFAALIQFSRDLKAAQGVLFLSGLSPKIRSLFAITKLETAFKIYENEEGALEDSCGY